MIISFLKIFDCRKAAAWMKTEKLLIELSSANGNYSTGAFVDELIAPANEKYEFDYPD